MNDNTQLVSYITMRCHAPAERCTAVSYNMTELEGMIKTPFPDGFLNVFSLNGGGNVPATVPDLAAAIGNQAFAQAIANNAYTDDVMREMPPEVAQRVAEMSTGYMDASQNDNSELSVGAHIVIKRYTEGWEQKFAEGNMIFTAAKDTHGGQTCATPWLLNMFQSRRAAIKRARVNSVAASTLVPTGTGVTGNAFAVLAAAAVDPFYPRRKLIYDQSAATAGPTSHPMVVPTDAARRFEETFLEGTRSIMELTSDDANDFPWFGFGALAKFEPHGDGIDPVAAIIAPGIAETRICSQFGYPRYNDYCYYAARKWPRQGIFREASYCDIAARNDELLQIRGFSTNDMPHSISGADNQITHEDTWYIDRERRMAVTHMEVGEWDEENDTFKIRVRESVQDSLDNLSQVVYDAYLMPGKIYPMGQFKGRFAVKDTYEQQLAGSMSAEEYNALERIFLFNIRRYYHT
jgi:hypothetical protein